MTRPKKPYKELIETTHALSKECTLTAPEQSILASGKVAYATAKDPWFGLTQHDMKVTGNTTRRVATESSSILMVTSTMAVG